MKKDLLKLQNNYFAASVENAKEANSAIGKAQGWSLTLGLAELTFFGSQGNISSCIDKIAVSMLLAAFLLFVTGSIAQYNHLLKSSRYYFSLSSKILKRVDDAGTSEADEIPGEFLDTQNLKTSSVANYFLFSSYILIGLSTIFIWATLIS